MEQSKNENENEIKSIENLNSKSENLFQIFFKIEKDDRFQKLIQSNFFAEKGFQERLKKTVKKFNQLIFEDFSSKIPPITINHLIISLSKMFFYTKENDFFLLHLITALFGIYHILQFPIEEKIKLWVIWNYFHLSLIGYIAEGAPSFSPRFSSFDLNDIPLVDSSWDYLVDHFLTNVPSRNEVHFLYFFFSFIYLFLFLFINNYNFNKNNHLILILLIFIYLFIYLFIMIIN